MADEIIKTCPFGSKCREIKDNKIHECMLFIHVKGMNPQTGEDVDESGCALTYTPLFVLESSRQIRGVAAATESFRNEVVLGQNSINNVTKIGHENNN